MNVSMKFARLASYILLTVASGVPPTTPAASADLPSGDLFPPCPGGVGIEPPPCNCKRRTSGVCVEMSCTYPGPLWFETGNPGGGFGCGGKLEGVDLEMARTKNLSGVPETHYILTYNLYTGNGFHDVPFGAGFYIDAVPDNAPRIYNIIGSRTDFDMSQCWYHPGRKFRVPDGNPHAPFYGIMPFDFTSYSVRWIGIRVDPPWGGRDRHC
jgi:hypothetical protein